MRLIAPLVVVVLAVGTAARVAAEEAAVPTFMSPPTRFVIEKQIGGVVGAPNGVAKATDELLIGDVSKQGLKFWFEIVGPNFHICSAAGVATRSGGSYEFSEGSCHLKITVSKEAAVVEDVSNGCEEDYCATRAAIGRAVFYPAPNPSVERTSLSPLRGPKAAAHVER